MMDLQRIYIPGLQDAANKGDMAAQYYLQRIGAAAGGDVLLRNRSPGEEAVLTGDYGEQVSIDPAGSTVRDRVDTSPAASQAAYGDTLSWLISDAGQMDAGLLGGVAVGQEPATEEAAEPAGIPWVPVLLLVAVAVLFFLRARNDGPER